MMSFHQKKISIRHSALVDIIKANKGCHRNLKKEAVVNFVLEKIGILNIPSNMKIVNFIARKLDKQFLNNFWKKFKVVTEKKKGFSYFQDKERFWLQKSFSFVFDINDINQLGKHPKKGTYNQMINI